MKTLTSDQLNRLEDVEHVASYTESKLGLDDEPEEEYEVDVYVGRMPDSDRWVVFEEVEGYPLGDGECTAPGSKRSSGPSGLPISRTATCCDIPARRWERRRRATQT
jgi:hypothetical protein